MQGFDHHVKEEHCMWNYIYYNNHLEKIDVNDHNAIDSYVYQLVIIFRFFSILYAMYTCIDKRQEN